jgi:hypothetical protein
MDHPWSFGWTQLLTIIGLLITITIAIGGFRTFERWRKEKLEEKRIDIAIEALALTYEARFIFDSIRSEMSSYYNGRTCRKNWGRPSSKEVKEVHFMRR